MQAQTNICSAYYFKKKILFVNTVFYNSFHNTKIRTVPHGDIKNKLTKCNRKDKKTDISAKADCQSVFLFGEIIPILSFFTDIVLSDCKNCNSKTYNCKAYINMSIVVAVNSDFVP